MQNNGKRGAQLVPVLAASHSVPARPRESPCQAARIGNGSFGRKEDGDQKTTGLSRLVLAADAAAPGEEAVLRRQALPAASALADESGDDEATHVHARRWGPRIASWTADVGGSLFGLPFCQCLCSPT